MDGKQGDSGARQVSRRGEQHLPLRLQHYPGRVSISFLRTKLSRLLTESKLSSAVPLSISSFSCQQLPRVSRSSWILYTSHTPLHTLPAPSWRSVCRISGLLASPGVCHVQGNRLWFSYVLSLTCTLFFSFFFIRVFLSNILRESLPYSTDKFTDIQVQIQGRRQHDSGEADVLCCVMLRPVLILLSCSVTYTHIFIPMWGFMLHVCIRKYEGIQELIFSLLPTFMPFTLSLYIQEFVKILPNFHTYVCVCVRVCRWRSCWMEVMGRAPGPSVTISQPCQPSC